MGNCNGRFRKGARTPLINGDAYNVFPTSGQALMHESMVHHPLPVADSKPTGPDEESVMTDSEFKSIMIDTLHRINRQGDASQIPSIAALLGHGVGVLPRSAQHPEIRIAAVEALRSLVPTFSSSWSGLPQILKILQITSTSDSNEAVRCASLRVLREVGQRGEEASLAACRCVLKDSNAGVDLRIQAVDTLQALVVRGDACSMQAALVALKDVDCAVRSGGLNILRQICVPYDESLEFLQDLAAVATCHSEVELRAGAIELISQVEKEGGSFGIKVATMCLHDIREEVQQKALTALRRMWKKADPEAVNMLVGLLKGSRDAELRCLALEVLASVASRGDTVAVLASIQILGDQDSSVQLAAAQALKQLCVRGDAEAVDALFAYVSHNEPEVQRLAIEVLGVVATPQHTHVVAAFQNLRDEGDLGLQLAVEQALRQMR